MIVLSASYSPLKLEQVHYSSPLVLRPTYRGIDNVPKLITMNHRNFKVMLKFLCTHTLFQITRILLSITLLRKCAIRLTEV